MWNDVIQPTSLCLTNKASFSCLIRNCSHPAMDSTVSKTAEILQDEFTTDFLLKGRRLVIVFRCVIKKAECSMLIIRV